MGLNHLVENRLAHRTGDPLYFRSIFEYKDRWNGADLELSRQAWGIVDVHFSHRDATVLRYRKLIEYRLHHLARPAPGSPEVDKHGMLAVANGGGEIVHREMLNR